MDRMANEDLGDDGLPLGETPGERRARVAREAEIIARGEKDFAEGRFVEWSVLRRRWAEEDAREQKRGKAADPAE